MAACACVMGGSSIRGRLSERHEQGYLKLGLDRVIKGDCYIFTRPHKDRQACTPVNHTHEPHERKCQVRTQGERRGGGGKRGKEGQREGGRGGKRDREREGEEGRGTEKRREEGQRKGGGKRDREEEGQRNGGTERGTEDHGAHSRAYEAHAQPAWPHP